MATKALLADLVAVFEAHSGVKVAITSVGGVDAAKRVAADEAFDLVLLASDALDTLIGLLHWPQRAALDKPFYFVHCVALW